MKKFLCHPVHLFVAAACFTILVMLVGIYLYIGGFIPAAVFGVIAALYGYENANALSAVSIDRNGVTKYVMGIQGFTYSWIDIQEVGVIFPRYVSRKRRDKRAGQCSIYFSARRLTSDERLKACLNWPPRDIIEMAYDADRMRAAAQYWDKEWILFNISAKELFGMESTLFSFNYKEMQY